MHKTKQWCTVSLSMLFTIAVWYDTLDMSQHKVAKHNLSSLCHLTTLLSGSYFRNKVVTRSSRCLNTGSLSQKIHSMFLPQVSQWLLASQMFPEEIKISMEMVLTEKKSCFLSREISFLPISHDTGCQVESSLQGLGNWKLQMLRIKN